jgi:hypothetical protein
MHVVASCAAMESKLGYNAKTSSAWKSQRNQAGVATTQTSARGEAKTKNGNDVYQSANGKTVTRRRITTAAIKVVL